MDMKSLFEYNWHCRRKFLESMAKLPWEKVVENRGASFDSLRNVFLHSLEAEHGLLRSLSATGGWPRHDYDRDFQDAEAMRKYMDEVEAESRTYLTTLGPGDLDKIIPYGRNKSRVRVEDVLMHVVEEEIHHRGELICLMWQIDSEPPYISYTAYLVETKKVQ
jgi:uncharacterized damage-inducible protein DinB